MPDRRSSAPPANLNGIPRPGGRGGPVVKPRNMRGTLRRLWDLTRGHRRGLGWILLLSALASGVSILSPYLTGNAVTAISGKRPVVAALMALTGVYVVDWLIRFLQQYFMASIGQRVSRHIRQAQPSDQAGHHQPGKHRNGQRQ